VLCRLFNEGGYVHRSKVLELCMQLHLIYKHAEARPDAMSAVLGTSSLPSLFALGSIETQPTLTALMACRPSVCGQT
jgi:hypothetical protein